MNKLLMLLAVVTAGVLACAHAHAQSFDHAIDYGEPNVWLDASEWIGSPAVPLTIDVRHDYRPTLPPRQAPIVVVVQQPAPAPAPVVVPRPKPTPAPVRMDWCAKWKTARGMSGDVTYCEVWK